MHLSESELFFFELEGGHGKNDVMHAIHSMGFLLDPIFYVSILTKKFVAVPQPHTTPHPHPRGGRLQRKPLASDPGKHHGTWVTLCRHSRRMRTRNFMYPDGVAVLLAWFHDICIPDACNGVISITNPLKLSLNKILPNT